MDAEDLGPALEGDHAGRHGRVDALGHVAPREAPEEALAAGADDQRPSDRGELVEAPQQFEVVLERLAEADPRVEVDAALGDAGGCGGGEPLLEERLDVVDD